MNLTPLRAAFLLVLSATAGIVSAQSTVRISLSTTGGQGYGDSYYPSLSDDGRFIAYYSDASTLVPGDTNAEGDIFLRDQSTGITTRISVDSNGLQSNGESENPSISADGRFVAFFSDATNLVSGDTNGADDVFVHDVLTGLTTCVSVDSNGVLGNGSSTFPMISADGRYVAFSSVATNLVSLDTNGVSDVFVHDRVSGTTTRVSVTPTGTQANGISRDASISADGNRIAFTSSAANLSGGGIVGNAFVHDRSSGNTFCVTVGPTGLPTGGGVPVISGDGRVVAYQSSLDTTTGAPTGVLQIHARDLVAGVTELISVDPNGLPGNGISSYLAISGSGRYVAFGSVATSLVPNDTNDTKDIFVRDRRTHTTTRVSVNSQLGQSNGRSSTPAISANGRFVGFYSEATNLVHGDTNAREDVYVRSLW